MNAEVFLDTNVLLYLLSADNEKADLAESIVRDGAVISVQALNEFTAVARRKLKLTWSEIGDVLHAVQTSCSVESLTVDGHTRGRQLAERYGFSVYDAMIVSSALQAGCTTLYTEDMQHGMRVRAQLTLHNPFESR